MGYLNQKFLHFSSDGVGPIDAELKSTGIRENSSLAVLLTKIQVIRRNSMMRKHQKLRKSSFVDSERMTKQIAKNVDSLMMNKYPSCSLSRPTFSVLLLIGGRK